MDLSEQSTQLAQRVSQMKLALYTRLLRKNFLDIGVDESTFDTIAQATNLELAIQESEEKLLERALSNLDSRGIDMLGRLIVEYCFVRTDVGRMIWPVYSNQDTSARWHHISEVLPRPLMRYFLVSLRGPLSAIDGYSATPFFFENTPEFLEEAHEVINQGIEKYRGPFGSGESAIDWPSLYEDPQFLRLGLDIISAMRKQLAEAGPEAYMERLEDYRVRDPESEAKNLMQRPFSQEDFDQIAEALDNAEQRLLQAMGSEHEHVIPTHSE